MTPGGHNGSDRVRPPANGGLPVLTDETLDELMAAPLAVVIVAEAGNANAGRYLAEVGALVARGDLSGVSVAVLDREEAAGSRFAREHPWLSGLRLLPYTVVFEAGRRVDGFAAVQADVLLARLARAGASAGSTGTGSAGRGGDGDWWSIPLGCHRSAA